MGIYYWKIWHRLSILKFTEHLAQFLNIIRFSGRFKCETLVDFLLAVYFISREGGVFSIFMCLVYFGHIINEELGWKETAIWG